MNSSIPDLYLPSSLAKDFPNDGLVDQFILTRSPEWIPESWNKRMVNTWHLGTYPTLPVIQFTFANSNITCILLGFIATASGKILQDGQTFTLSFSNSKFIDEFENWLYTHSGRYIAILSGSDFERVYLDPCGSLATTYSGIAETVSSTNMLIPYIEGLDDNISLINDFRIPLVKGNFAFGLDPRHNVKSLVANHYLNLSDWSTARHWPTEDFITCNNPRDNVDKIGTLLGNIINSFAEHYGRVQLPVTAGGDSRMLLAASKKSREKIDLYTFDLKPCVDKADIMVGSAVATHAKLPHKIYKSPPPTEHDLRQWIWRNGASANAMIGWKNQHAFRSLNPSYPSFPALLGELGRPIIYKDIEEIFNPLNIPLLLNRWHIPVNAETIEGAQSWIDNLNISDPMTIMGLFYMENRIAPWAGPVLYSQCKSGSFSIFPFNNREIITLLLSLPKHYRLQENLIIDMIRQKWPDLLYPAFSNESRVFWLSKLLLSAYGRNWCPLKAKK